MLGRAADNTIWYPARFNHEQVTILAQHASGFASGNDFHSRGGAPDIAPFCTVVEHTQRVQRKLGGLEQNAGVSIDKLDARLTTAISQFDESKQSGADPVAEQAHGASHIKVRQNPQPQTTSTSGTGPRRARACYRMWTHSTGPRIVLPNGR